MSVSSTIAQHRDCLGSGGNLLPSLRDPSSVGAWDLIRVSCQSGRRHGLRNDSWHISKLRVWIVLMDQMLRSRFEKILRGPDDLPRIELTTSKYLLEPLNSGSRARLDLGADEPPLNPTLRI